MKKMKQMIDCETLVIQEQDYFLHKVDIDSCQEKIETQLATDHKEPVHTYLGTAFVASQCYEYTLNNETGVYTKVWFQEDELAKIEVFKTWTIDEKIRQALTDLGAPSLKCDYYLDVIPMEDKVWIYPEQGLAIFFGISDDSIYRVVYFKATTSEAYLATLHNEEKPREF
jgi:hypothetical protein